MLLKGQFVVVSQNDSIVKPLRIYCDNFAVVFFWKKNDRYSKGDKCMELKYFFVK